MTSDTDTPSTRLLRGARLVPVGVPGRATGGPVDVLVRGGRVVEVAPDLPAPPGGGVLDLDGRFLVPGLWDQHVHLTQWARTLQRVDLSGTDGPGEVARRVGAHIAALPRESRGRLVHGWGFRAAAWDERPTVAVLDAVSRDHPVVAVSGDGHSGWLNSRALELLGLGHHEFALDENEWFAAFDRLDELPGAAPAADEGYADALAGASALGVVGVVDLEFD
ncbi:MAG TPA: amidohydrolase family protein, partial [Segeticoccus sp.]|nr:amidohydrolase family protein [Segeticoccus sp.]